MITAAPKTTSRNSLSVSTFIEGDISSTVSMRFLTAAPVQFATAIRIASVMKARMTNNSDRCTSPNWIAIRSSTSVVSAIRPRI